MGEARAARPRTGPGNVPWAKPVPPTLWHPIDKMSGPLRKRRTPWNFPGQAHEVTFSTFNKLPVLSLPGAADAFLNCLDEARRKVNLMLHAYVVMPTHVHILIRPKDEEYSMSTILSAIKTPSAKAIFDLHPDLRETMRVHRPSRGFEARFWMQGGGFDRNVPNLKAGEAMVAYIHSNPVRAGLCTDPAEWKWSSYPEFIGGTPPIPVDPTDWY